MRVKRGGPGTRPVRRALVIGAVTLTLACATGAEDNDVGHEEEAAVSEPIEQVLIRRTPELMRIAGVQGVGQGLCDGTPCIRVYVADSAAVARLPTKLDGYIVSPVVTGMIRATTD